MKKMIQIVVLVMLGAAVLWGQTITAVRIPNAIADAGGTGTTGYPYAVFIQISGWTALASGQAYVKIYSGTNNEYMWSATGVWSNTTTYSTANQPVVNIDASGNWSGWIYAKHNSAITSAPAVRAAKVGTSSTNLTSATKAFTILNMATTGGWLVASSSSAVNKGVVAFSGGQMVGSYRTEDNGITEGYSYSAGGFKIAGPTGLIDSAVFYNDDGTRFSSMIGPWSITAGNSTDANIVISVSSGAASLSPSLWKFNTPTTVKMVFTPSTDTVRNVRMIRPATLQWNTGSVTVTPPSATVTASADSIQIDNLALNTATDTLVVSLGGVTAVDTTGSISMIVRSSKDGITFGQIAQSPSMMVYSSPRAMSQVKAKDGGGLYLLNGKYVVVRGIVTVANEFGGPSYLQDGTAGIAVYDSSVSNNVNRGDDVTLLGVVSPYNGMFEINPCKILEKASEGNPVDTLTISIAQIKAQQQNGVEPYECRFIRVNNITSVVTTGGSSATSWAVTGSGTNYELIAGSDTLEVRISAKTNIAGTAIPSGKFDIVGALGQFTTYYQILPRSLDDFMIEGAGPRIISGVPYESKMTDTSITFTWVTDAPGSSIVNLGTTTAYGVMVTDPNYVTQHSLTVLGLSPATVYHVQLGSTNAGGTTYSLDFLVSSASHSSTGTINVYFNQPVDNTLARGENALNVGTGISQKLINRINAATSTIDIALYSLSGTVGNNIAAALVGAKNRGVQVRVIGEADNSSTTPWSVFGVNGIPNIFDTFDATNAGVGLMHNKFAVFDNQDVSDTNDWVWTGSWNATDSGNNNDAQNVVEIQDKALANAYTLEFNEMWGSTTATPVAVNSRFGAHKLNNTPHYFNVHGTPIECYFSPSDGTSSQIIKTLTKAKESIDICMLTFTYSGMATALTTSFRSGVKVRGVIDNKTDTGEQYDTLFARGMDVHLKANVSGLLHHKYAIVDPNGADSNKYVITGSHNWSSSAETKNNENTLIMKSARLVNLYLQEFSVRYVDAGGKDKLLGVKEIQGNLPHSYGLSQNFPNPFNPTSNIQFQIPSAGIVTLKVYDVLGREVAVLLNEAKPAGTYQVLWNASLLPSGVYFYQISAGSYRDVKKAVLIK